MGLSSSEKLATIHTQLSNLKSPTRFSFASSRLHQNVQCGQVDRAPAGDTHMLNLPDDPLQPTEEQTTKWIQEEGSDLRVMPAAPKISLHSGNSKTRSRTGTPGQTGSHTQSKLIPNNCPRTWSYLGNLFAGKDVDRFHTAGTEPQSAARVAQKGMVHRVKATVSATVRLYLT